MPMRAIEIKEPGALGVLKLCQKPVPSLLPNDVLIAVKSAGINRPDVLQRRGVYPPPRDASELPGLEVAGIVEKVGADVTDFAVGDKVCALTAGGGYAEYVCADEGSVLPIPKGFDFVQAAALPENYFTVWYNVFERGQLKKGETFLVHGGSSGIGTTAIQLSKAFGAEVFTTAGSEEKCHACRQLGAHFAINYRTDDFVHVIKEKTNNKGVDVILDMVGGDYIGRNYTAACVEGRIVQIAFLQGARTKTDFTQLMIKRLTHTGSTLRPRSKAFKKNIAQLLYTHVWPLLENGDVEPVIDRIYPLEQADKAHQYMEESNHIGKIMLSL